MQKTIEFNKGIYLLEIYASNNFYIKHNNFSDINFKKGYYYYVGSAQRSLLKRIKRHILKNKIIRWHIDFITSLQQTKIKRIFILQDANKLFENLLAERLNTVLQTPAIGFGSSDDKKVSSHLFFSKKQITHNHFSDLYHSIVCLKPDSAVNDG